VHRICLKRNKSEAKYGPKIASVIDRFLLLFAPFQLVAQPSKIHVSAPSKSLTCFPAHLTREKGFYRAEGLDVDFVVMKPQVALQALIAGVRGLPLRVVMTIADKPLFALMARPGVNSVEELKGKLVFK